MGNRFELVRRTNVEVMKQGMDRSPSLFRGRLLTRGGSRNRRPSVREPQKTDTVFGPLSVPPPRSFYRVLWVSVFNFQIMIGYHFLPILSSGTKHSQI